MDDALLHRLQLLGSVCGPQVAAYPGGYLVATFTWTHNHCAVVRY